MKRLIVLIIAACVISIGVLQAVECDWIADPEDTMDCDCAYDWCYGIGSLEISYDCPESEGECPQGKWCDFGSSGYDYALTYAEPDCYTWPRPCDDPDDDCVVEGLDSDTVVISRIGECYCK